MMNEQEFLKRAAEEAGDGGLHYREFTIRQVTRNDDGSRTVSGIGVPYDVEANVRDWLGDYREIFDQGAVQNSEDAKVCWRHGEVIGKVTRQENTPEGWEVDALILPTRVGRDAIILVDGGAVDQFSIGFEYGEYEFRDGGELMAHKKVRAREVSLTPFPVYETAKVKTIREQTKTTPREENPQMTEITTETIRGIIAEELTATREQLTDVERRIITVQDGLDTTRATEFTTGTRSAGEWARTLLDEQRGKEHDGPAHRALEGIVTGDTVMKDTWIGSLVQIIEKPQYITKTFLNASDLPATGMGVEYAVLASDTTQVTQQAAEGDTLAYGKVSITSKPAQVITAGGYTVISFQARDRATVGVLDTAMLALAEKYGRFVEGQVLTVFNAAVSTAETVTADLTTQDGVIAGMLDTIEAFEDNGRNLDGLLMGKAAFKALYAVPATDRILQVSGAPTDKIGTITLASSLANVGPVAIRYIPTLAPDTVVAYDHTAIRTMLSPGAPLRLQQEAITNLTEAFSMYGYMASFCQKPDGLMKLAAA